MSTSKPRISDRHNHWSHLVLDTESSNDGSIKALSMGDYGDKHEDSDIDVRLPKLEHPDTDTSWRDDALCRSQGSAKFFESKSKHIAIAICNNCPSQDPCLKFATNNNMKDGVWGGKDFGRSRK